MLAVDSVVTLGDWLEQKWFPVLIFVAFTLLMWWRTGSAHLFWSRLWTVFIGRRCRSDSPVERFHEAQTEMLKFRFLTNIAVVTPRQVEPIIRWLDRYDQPPTAVAHCGPYFDVAKPGLSEPAERLKSYWVIAPLLIWMALTLAAMPFAYGVVQGRALLTFKQSGHWFTLDEQRAKRFSSSPGFEISECAASHKDIARRTDFLVAEVTDICEAARRGELPRITHEGVTDQRPWFGAFAIVLLFCSLFFARTTRQMEAALQLRANLRKRIGVARDGQTSSCAPDESC